MEHTILFCLRCFRTVANRQLITPVTWVLGPNRVSLARMDLRAKLAKDIAHIDRLLELGGYSPAIRAALLAAKLEMQKELLRMNDQSRDTGS
jgi:hypothetical protein